MIFDFTMIFTPEQREQVRLSILRYALQPISTGLICANLRAEGYRQITRDQAETELRYLSHPQKALIEAQDKAVSPEVAIWRTTPKGMDYLAQQGEES